MRNGRLRVIRSTDLHFFGGPEKKYFWIERKSDRVDWGWGEPQRLKWVDSGC